MSIARGWLWMLVIASLVMATPIAVAVTNSRTEPKSANHQPAPTQPTLTLIPTRSAQPFQNIEALPRLGLPNFVPSAYGPIRIIIKANLFYDGDSLYGMWHPHIRTIFIRDSLPPWFALAVLDHELCHVAFTDYDVPLPAPVEERACDAIAQQRSIERLSR